MIYQNWMCLPVCVEEGELGFSKEKRRIQNWALLAQGSLKREDLMSCVLQSCLILCEPMDCRLPGSSVHGILQARILEWLAMPFSRGSTWPRDQTLVSHIAGRFFTIWATQETWYKPYLELSVKQIQGKQDWVGQIQEWKKKRKFKSHHEWEIGEVTVPMGIQGNCVKLL